MKNINKIHKPLANNQSGKKKKKERKHKYTKQEMMGGNIQWKNTEITIRKKIIRIYFVDTATNKFEDLGETGNLPGK